MGQQRVTAQNPGEWFMIAGEGDMVLRIRPGMSLGETAAGDLSFNPDLAQLTLDITDDGSLSLAAASDFELQAGDETPRTRAKLTRYSRADICLPHHVLRVDTDFVDPLRPKGSVAILTVRPMKKVAEARVARLRKVLAEESGEQPTSEAALPQPSSQPQAETTPIYPPARGRTIVEPLRPRAPVDSGPPARRKDARKKDARKDERKSGHRRPILTPGALVGLAVVVVALLFPVLYEISAPLVADIVRAPPDAPTEAPAVVTEPASPAIETAPSVIPVPPETQRLVDPSPPPVAEPEPPAEIAQRPSERVSEPESVTAPVAPQPAPPATPTPAAAPEPAAPAERVVDPAVLAELDDIGAAAQAAAAGMARRLDLLEADYALAQGRLTRPSEASAYMLYTRVLAEDPDSAEARRGLQAVRQRLINQTLAQLASGQLERARISLQDAEDVGANPRLIADLRYEIGFRQQQIDPRN